MQPDASVDFPPFRLDLVNHELWRDGRRLALRPKPFAVLAYLATHANRLVPHAELVRAVWPDTRVGEGMLRGYVRDVRSVLGDDPAEPRFIETVARLGYRFVAPIRDADDSVERTRASGIVGREVELRELERRLARAIGGERQIVFVTGEPGIGKTTLVDRFIERAEVGHAVRTARGQCVDHFGASEAYLPLLEALGGLGRQPLCEEVTTVFLRHAPTWLVQLPALIGDTELEAVQRRAQGATRERMLREFAEGVEVLSAVRPLVVVLEDLQWSDDSTLDLLSSVARRRGEARLLVLCTYRPADVVAGTHPLSAIKRELQQHDQCAEVALRSFDLAQVDDYLAHRFPGRRLAPDIGRALHRATEGNPLFVMNLVDWWVTRNVLVEEDGAWKLDPRLAAVGAEVPDTLRQMIEQQLDRLSGELRHMLEAASVVGREFSTATVAAALGETQDHIDERCEGLAARGLFLRARGIQDLAGGAVADRYEFLHALYRQVLYERQAAARRVRLHRRIGEWEADAYGTHVQEHAAELAVHFERGHDRRAAQHLESAARNAMRKHAYREATALLGRALNALAALSDTAERGRQELSLQMALGTSLLMTRGYAAPEVEAAFNRARDLARHVSDAPELVFALAGLFRFFVGRARFRLARDLGDEVLRLAAAAHDRSLLAVAHGMVGIPLLGLAELVPAREHLEQSVACYDIEQHRSIAPEHGDDPALTALAFLAIGLWFLGHPDQALERSRQGEAIAEQLAAPYSVAFARSFSTWIHIRRGEVALARSSSEALMALAAEQGFTFVLSEASIFHGWALARQGEVDRGIELMRQGLSRHRAAGIEMGRPSHLALLAEAYALGHRFDDGLGVLEEAIATAADTGECSYVAELYRLRGDLLREKAGRTGRKSAIETQAEEALREGIAIARRQRAKSLELRAVLALCRLRHASRKHADTRRLLAEVYGWFTEGFGTGDLTAAQALLQSS